MNSGKDLEQLVKAIEGHLLGNKFSVTVRERKFDDTGKQIAEFDIVVKGFLGSIEINWLFECRDRPSAGPAPAEWIEQLVGRRDRFNFDKVIAVSTTGFSQPAIDYAREKGILLRSVNSIEEISEDLSIKYMHLVLHNLLITGAVDLGAPQKEGKREIDVPAPKLKMLEETEYLEFDEFILRDIERTTPIFQNGRTPIKFSVDKNLDAIISDEKIRLTYLRVPVEVETKVIDGKALLTRKYTEPGKVIGEEGVFSFVTPNGEFNISVVTVYKSDGTKDVNVNIPKEMRDKYIFTNALATKHKG